MVTKRDQTENKIKIRRAVGSIGLRRRKPCARLLAGSSFAAIASSLGAALAQSLPSFSDTPTNNIVVSPNFQGEGPATGLTITQSGSRGIANWFDFSLSQGTTVDVVFTSDVADPSSAITLNRVIGDDGSFQQSVIDGRINSPGQFWLINPRGIYVSSAGVIDVAGFLGSTANITDNDFLSGDDTYTFGDAGDGLVENDGQIIIKEGTATSAYAILAANGVSLGGTIGGSVQTVVLAGAEAYILTLAGVDGFAFDITKAVEENANQLFAAVEVTGSGNIDATGRVLIEASALDQLFDSSVNIDGVVFGDTVSIDGSGDVVIGGYIDGGEVDVSALGDVLVNGTISASGDVEINSETKIAVCDSCYGEDYSDVSSYSEFAVESDPAAGFGESENAQFQTSIEGQNVSLIVGGGSPGEIDVAGAILASDEILLASPNIFVEQTYRPGATLQAGSISILTDYIEINASISSAVAFFSTYSAGNDILLLDDSTTVSSDYASALAIRQRDIDAIIADEIQFSASLSQLPGNIPGNIIVGGPVSFAGYEGGTKDVFLFGSEIFTIGNGRLIGGRLGASASGDINLGQTTQSIDEFAAYANGSVLLKSNGGLTISDGLTFAALDLPKWQGGSIAGILGGSSGPSSSGLIDVDVQGTVDILGDVANRGGTGGVRLASTGNAFLASTLSSDSAVQPNDPEATSVVLASSNGNVLISSGAAIDPGNGRFLVFTGSPENSRLDALSALNYFNTAYDPSDIRIPAENNRFVFRGQNIISVFANDLSREYGNPNPDFLAPGFGAEWSAIDGAGRTVSGSVFAGAPVLSTNATQQSDVGRYDIFVFPGNLTTDDNSSLSFANGTLRVTPAQLVVAANGTREYGDPNDLSSVVVGIIGGSLKLNDTLNDVVSISSTVFTTDATQSSDVGDYGLFGSIVSEGGFNPNYDVSFGTGVYSVTPAPLSVTANGNREYGDMNDFSGVTLSLVSGPLKLSDTLSDVVFVNSAKFTTNATRSSNVGVYDLFGEAAVTSNKNYSLFFDTGTFEVTPAPLAVTAAASRDYGDANDFSNVELSVVSGGLKLADVLGDVVNVAPGNFATDAVIDSDVGQYQLSLLDGLSGNGNYAFEFVTGTYDILPVELVIAANGTREYGDANDLAAVRVGVIQGSLKLGDTLSDVAIINASTFTTDALQSSDVGEYRIFGSVQTEVPFNPNYQIMFADGVYTITPAPLALTANSSREYGEVNEFSGLGVSIVGGGLKLTDNLSDVVSVSGSGFASNAEANSDVGVYDLFGSDAISVLTKNYSVQFRTGSYEVTPAPLSVTGTASRVYGDPNDFSNIQFALVSGGLKLDDTVNDALGTASGSFASDAVINSDVGAYALTNVGNLASNGNYDLQFIPGVYEVVPASIVVTATGSREYGDPNDFSNLQITLLDGQLKLGQGIGEAINLDPDNFTSDAEVASNVGNYGLFGNSDALTSGNYIVQFQIGTYQVVPAPLVVQVVAQRPVGTSTSFTDVNLVPDQNTPLKLGQELDDVASFSFQTNAGLFSPPGTYDLQVTAIPPSNGNSSLFSNYDIEFEAPVIFTVVRNDDIEDVAATTPVQSDLPRGNEPSAPQDQGGVARPLDDALPDSLLNDSDLFFESTLSNGGNESIW